VTKSSISGTKIYRGYIASKRRYYYGLKLHIVVSDKKYTVEFEVTEASKNDVTVLYLLSLNLEGKILYGDRAYNDYFAEDALRECDNVKLEVIRKKNSKRFDYYKQKLVAYFRKTVETAGSILTTNFPRKIHAVTLDGFIRKIYYFVLSFNINYLIKLTYN